MFRKLFYLMVLSAVLTLLAAAGVLAEPSHKGYARGSSLITAQELKKLIDSKDPKLVIIAAANDVEYRLGHIPGSLQLDRPEYEAPAETQEGVTGNLIDAAGFTVVARRMGIDRDSKVVVYDTRYDATRLWWAFFYYGKADVRVLDGGIKAWKDSGYETDVLATGTAKAGSFTARIANPRLRVETAEIASLENGKKGQLWDNRDRKEYCGEELKKGAYRKGRIPWGLPADWALFKKKENAAEWIAAADAKTLLKQLGVENGKDQYFFCQSGVRSTQALFTYYLLGWPVEKLHNYDSSWIGWSKDPKLAIVTGCSTGDVVAKAPSQGN